MRDTRLGSGCWLLASAAALCGMAALPGIASAAPATSALAMTASNLQTTVNTPASQQSPAQRALATQALREATLTVTPEGAAPGPEPAPSSPTTTATTGSPAAVGSCFGAVWERDTLSTLGVTLAWTQVGVQGWCAGPGNTAIVSVSGWNFPSYTAATYCTKSNEKYHGGDGSHVGPNTTWAHGLHILQIGEGVNGACAGIRTIEQGLRIAYTGYWDGYDDWGF